LLKYFLALKVILICKKFKDVNNEEYFTHKMQQLNVGSILEEEKKKMKEILNKDEQLEEIFRDDNLYDSSLLMVK
jgi:hypothetical protein